MSPDQSLPKSDKMNSYAPDLMPADGSGGDIDLFAIFGILLEARWFVLGTTLTAVLIGLAYLYIVTPIYSVDAMIQVEERQSRMKGLGDLSALFGNDIQADSEIEILRSRAIAGAVVDQLKLDIVAEPETFPVIGRAMMRRYQGALPADPPYAFLSSYAWGGEVIRVDTLEVPKELHDKTLFLVALGNASYGIVDQEGNKFLEGRENQVATGHGVSIFVNQLVARPGTNFVLMKRSHVLAISILQRMLSVQEKGRKTGVLSLSMEGSDPKHLAEIVNTAAEYYLRQNVERRSEEAQKMLDFLNAALPRLRLDAMHAESALSAYRSRTATLGKSFAAEAFVHTSSELEKQIALLGFEKAELEQRFTGDFPALVVLRKKIAQMQEEKKKLMADIKHLPETELEAVNLERDAKVANEVYTMLLNKVQELSVTRAGTIGNVHIIDRADVPVLPIRPKNAIILSTYFVFGLLISIGLVTIRRAFFNVVEDPDAVERLLGLSVYATIPHSDKIKNKKKGEIRILLGREFPKDITMESVRSLRTSVQFALMESKNNIIGITGPTVGVGKSFVSVNLALSLAEAGKRVLLIDADMRKGYLHEYFGIERTNGLSKLVGGEISMDAAIHATGVEGLHIMPSGAMPHNPAEILISERFQKVIQEISTRYDVVIIDTPPVLAVTDACIIGRYVGMLFLVLRFARHPMREIEHTYKRVRQNGIRVQGIVFNDTPVSGRHGHYYGYGYGYGAEK